MIRRTPLKRSTKPIAKRRPGKPRRGPADIPAEEWRNHKYLRFLRELGTCDICHRSGKVTVGTCDPCHTENGGMRMKGPDRSCVPLCRTHHTEYDAGRTLFERKYDIDMKQESESWWFFWQEML